MKQKNKVRRKDKTLCKRFSFFVSCSNFRASAAESFARFDSILRGIVLTITWHHLYFGLFKINFIIFRFEHMFQNAFAAHQPIFLLRKLKLECNRFAWTKKNMKSKKTVSVEANGKKIFNYFFLCFKVRATYLRIILFFIVRFHFAPFWIVENWNGKKERIIIGRCVWLCYVLCAYEIRFSEGQTKKKIKLNWENLKWHMRFNFNKI